MFRRNKGDHNKSTPSSATEPRLLPQSEWRSFVEASYRGILGRAADDEGAAYALARLEQGCSATEFLYELMNSQEHRWRRLGLLEFTSDPADSGISAEFAHIGDALEHVRSLDQARFEEAWQQLPNFAAYQVVGQAEYCEQHKQRFFELANAVAVLTWGIDRPRILEIGVSAFSNLYSILFPDITLQLADRPTADDYPGFTGQRCEAITGCNAFYPLDLSEPSALDSERLGEMSGYDLIVFAEVLPLLAVHPGTLLNGLLSRLSAEGFLYLTSSNFFSAAARTLLAEGRNPAPYYPPGDENWDCHHAFRQYSGRELRTLVQQAGGETCGFYFSACLDQQPAAGQPRLEADQRSTLVLAVRRRREQAAAVSDTEREIVIHIGSDKAGSTAIQSHVYGNRHWLRSQGIYVPDVFLGQNNGHARLMEELTADKLAALVAEIDEQGTSFGTVFLSWEGAHFLPEEDVRLLAQYLGRWRVRIIFFLREQADVIQSGLLQQIKGRKQHVDLRQEAACPSTPDTRNYYQTLKRWENSFAELACEVVYYDRSAFPDGNVVKDLLQRLGCENHAGFIFYERDINTSLDVASALAVESKLASTSPGDSQLRYFVDSVLLSLKLRGAGQRYFFNREQVAKLRQHYQPSNLKLVEEYGVSEKLLRELPTVHVQGPENFSAAIQSEVDAIVQDVEALSSHPVCFGGFIGGESLQVYLAEGWSGLVDGGYWSDGEHSLIRLRPLLLSIFPCHRWLLIKLRGRYQSATPGSTGVSINGKFLGDYDLGNGVIALPLEDLPEDLHVDLRLDHRVGGQPNPNAIFIEALNVLASETY